MSYPLSDFNYQNITLSYVIGIIISTIKIVQIQILLIVRCLLKNFNLLQQIKKNSVDYTIFI